MTGLASERVFCERAQAGCTSGVGWAMGSGVSHDNPEGPRQCRAPEPFVPPPPKDGVVPNRVTHDLYIAQLEHYLINVACHPQAFQKKVDMRRDARFGELWNEVAVPELPAVHAARHNRADWLPDGL